jgi:hypothetical protein
VALSNAHPLLNFEETQTRMPLVSIVRMSSISIVLTLELSSRMNKSRETRRAMTKTKPRNQLQHTEYKTCSEVLRQAAQR